MQHDDIVESPSITRRWHEDVPSRREPSGQADRIEAGAWYSDTVAYMSRRVYHQQVSMSRFLGLLKLAMSCWVVCDDTSATLIVLSICDTHDIGIGICVRISAPVSDARVV